MTQKIILFSGVACAGKSSLAREVARAMPSAFLLDNDVVKNALACVRPTIQMQLPPVEAYLRGLPVTTITIQDAFGERIDVPPANEFHGRHVRDQAYRAMLEIAEANLNLGKMPIYESLFPNQFQSGVAGRILDQFNGRNVLVHLFLPQEILRERMVQRAKISPEYAVKDGAKLESDETWRDYLLKNPLIPPSLERYPHLKIDSSKSPRICLDACLSYISEQTG